MVIRGEQLDQDYFADSTPELTEHQASYGVEAIAHALVNIYRENVDVDSDIEENLFQETRRMFEEAVAEGYAEASQKDIPLPDETFRETFLHSADVFSAFRVHKMQNDIAAQMIDENGHVKPFRQFVKDVSPYIEHRNRAWLQTEYDTAILRAQNAAEWQQFQDEKDVYPNLEWIQSTSPNPGADHMVFWGTVLPVDDPFWDEHKPGDRWNCKCELRQTDKGATQVPVSDGKSDAAPGLESNPAKAKEVFSDNHPYYPDSCSSCPFAGGKLMALAHDLVSGKDCHHCRRVNKCIATAEKKAEAKRKSKRQAKDSALSKAFEKVHTIKVRDLSVKALQTGTFHDSPEGLRALLSHCYSEDTIRAALALRHGVKKLDFVRPSALGEGKDMSNPHDRKNLKRKKKRGVVRYNLYHWRHKGHLYAVKMEENECGHESLYWIRKIE